MAKDKRITWRRLDASSLDLSGWKVAVIGGTGGLGRAISQRLAKQGAHVTIVGQTFRDHGTARIDFVQADLGLMKEAERVAKALPAESLDLVLFTTGIFAAPKREATSEGIERDMAVSYLNRLVMLRELGPRLGKDRSAKTLAPRVFVMGYPGAGQEGTLGDLNAEKSYGAMWVHMNTVTGNECLVHDATRRYPALNTYGLNPGIIKTNIRDNFLGQGSLRSRFAEWMIDLFNPTPETYADRIVPLLVSPDLESHRGAMFDQKADAILPTPKLTDRAHVDRFLSESEELVKTKASVALAS